MSQNVDENEEYEQIEKEKEANNKNGSGNEQTATLGDNNSQQTEAAVCSPRHSHLQQVTVIETTINSSLDVFEDDAAPLETAAKQAVDSPSQAHKVPTKRSPASAHVFFNTGAKAMTHAKRHLFHNPFKSRQQPLQSHHELGSELSSITDDKQASGYLRASAASVQQHGTGSTGDNRTNSCSDSISNKVDPPSGTPNKNRKFKFQKKPPNQKFTSKADNASYQTPPPRDVFVELEQLFRVEKDELDGPYDFNPPTWEWREVSRWIKYEQNVDFENGLWSKPFVGALIYQSLFYLKTGLQYGTVLLNSDHESLESLVSEMIQDFIDSGHMNKDNREQVKRTLLSAHKHSTSGGGYGGGSSLSRKKSTISDFFSPSLSSRRQSTHTNSAIETPLNIAATPVVHVSDLNVCTDPESRKNSTVTYNTAASVSSAIDVFVSGTSTGKKLSNSEIDLDKEKRKSSPQRLQLQHDNSVKFKTVNSGGTSSIANANASLAATSSVDIQNSVSVVNLNDHSPAPLPRNKRRRSTIAMLKNTVTHSKLYKSDNSLKGFTHETEAFVVMVGVVDFLDRPVMAFVRLTNAQVIEDLVEIPQMKVKFLFVLLGPKNENIDYLEIGRCIGTLMTNKEFHESVYRAADRHELIEAITHFSNKSLCVVLPVGNFDQDLLAPIIDWMQMKLRCKMLGKSTSDQKIYEKNNVAVNRRASAATAGKHSTMLNKTAAAGGTLGDMSTLESSDGSPTSGGGGEKGNGNNGGKKEHFDPFARTGCLFGALFNEIRHRYSQYASDFTDALNAHCMIALIFVFTVSVAPALSFGGILADKTNRWFGVNEMLIATSMNGIISGLFSGQPLVILGPTGPFLVFEEMLLNFCRDYFCIEYLATRCWVSLWVLAFTLIMLAFEGVYVIHYVTRFTEEIFGFLIASVFLLDATKKIFRIFVHDPIYTTEMYCNYSAIQHVARFPSNSSVSIASSSHCALYAHDRESINEQPSPNIALLSLILLLGTCVMALSLKKLRHSIFFGSYIRRTLSDVGMLLSIVLMCLLDYVIRVKTGVNTQKLDIPDGLVPTKRRLSWLVSPFGHNFNNSSDEFFPAWVPFASVVPALLVFIVLFFEVELTGMLLNANQRKLKKGTGFNLDLLIGALLMTLNSFLGLPWMCAAPVRTLAHWASLTVYSTTYVPGEKPKLIEVKEQRVTGILVHLAIGLCLLAKSTLKMIPISVTFGIFLYFGIASLSGTQLYERTKLIFIPSKYCPNMLYARGVRPSKRNLFTLIQVTIVVSLLIIKSFAHISFIFPLILVFLVPLRKFLLPKLFSNKELEQLDHDHEMNTESNGMTHDFYEMTHLPI